MNSQFERENSSEDPENIFYENLPHKSALTPIKSPSAACVDEKDDQSVNPHSKLQQEPGIGAQQQQIESIMYKVEAYNSRAFIEEADIRQLAQIFDKHVTANIHPSPRSAIGARLLANGKFVIGFVEMVTRNEPTDYLKKYLLNYFDQLNQIQVEKDFFYEERDRYLQKSHVRSEQKSEVKSKRAHLGDSPLNSNNQGMSLKVEQDTSSFKLSELDNSDKRGEAGRFKRSSRKVKEEVQQYEKSDKISHRSRKSKAKTTRKLNNTNTKAVEKSSRSSKKTLSKSANKKQHNHASPRKNQNDQDSKLGSCYHYEIIVNRRSKAQELKPVRTSARLSQRKSGRQDNSLTNSIAKERHSSVKKSNPKNKGHSTSKTKKNKQEQGEDPQEDIQQSQNKKIQVEWIKNHLKQLKIKDIQLYSEYKALTENDQKITQFLLEVQRSLSVPFQDQTITNKPTKKRNIKSKSPENNPNQTSIISFNLDMTEPQIIPEPEQEETSRSRAEEFQQIRNNFKIGPLPLIIESVVDPDLNGHGIYALLKLGRVTEIEMGTAYAVSPLTYGTMANRRHIKEDLEKAKLLSGSYGENIGYIPMNEYILNLVNSKKLD